MEVCGWASGGGLNGLSKSQFVKDVFCAIIYKFVGIML